MLKIHPDDNVAVATAAGEAVPFGHKMALVDIAGGGKVIKYGAPIGLASCDIAAGEHVHGHNLNTGLGGHETYAYEAKPPAPVQGQQAEFMGFRRPDGRVGIRNEIWIIPSVGCVNGIADIVARKAGALLRGSVEAVCSFPHPHGCSQLGDDHENTKKALCALAMHPNAGGVLVLGLGCENNGVDGMKELLSEASGERIKFLVCQEVGDEVAAALSLVEELITVAAADKRAVLPASELIVGLKCGGSDGLSGITANPLVGAFSDRLIAAGGSAILTEVPEMFGAETILMERCINESVFDKTVALINDFKDYFTGYGQTIYENPSPGNIAGGITTLEEKALGCTQKAGTSPVVAVLDYGEALSEKGLNLLKAPGNDLVAATALALSGAQLVLFTTGRGTPFACPVPTVKIASNTALYEKKQHWMDYNAGGLIEGHALPDMAEDFFSQVLDIASGVQRARSESGDVPGIAIFKDGVTL